MLHLLKPKRKADEDCALMSTMCRTCAWDNLPVWLARVWQKFCMWFLRGPAARNPKSHWWWLFDEFRYADIIWGLGRTCPWDNLHSLAGVFMWFLRGPATRNLVTFWWICYMILYEDWCPWDSLPAGWLARLDLSGVRMTTFACDELDCLSTWVRMIQHLR